jgi:urea-proton symporter
MATSILPHGAGYGIIVGVGAVFALGMWYLAILLAKFQNEVQGSEMFMTAKRSIKTGLVASAVVSSWTIAATLLTSSTWAYSYGVSGAYFYGAGATVQIFVFAVSAMELKRRAPGMYSSFVWSLMEWVGWEMLMQWRYRGTYVPGAREDTVW